MIKYNINKILHLQHVKLQNQQEINIVVFVMFVQVNLMIIVFGLDNVFGRIITYTFLYLLSDCWNSLLVWNSLKATFLRVFTVISNKKTFFVFIIFACLIFFISLTAFFLCHLNMIRKDLTTNETIRKNDFEKSFLNDMYQLQELEKKKDEESSKRLAQLKLCWSSLNKRKVQGLIKELKIVFSQPN
ncbi:unnamed protein product [Paramecium sonneborni]|uniref:Uncharacterized protein n=1 Tax=Paramecium sonneborni TaxID=65129 RepID=A0A8S1RM25_9CILI|nr:unnamed protein product [Paramecium sonneborni]CAD8128468.1 unnamed protein product [Paramecium sonneborni]